jgi:acetyl-CoA C-acetyltransferase
MVSVIGYYTTKFGELWEKSLFNLVEESITGVLNNTSLDIKDIDVIFFANMLGGVLENNLHSAAKISELLGVHIPIYRVESACASGGVAINMATNYLKSKSNSTVLVVGAEKMTDFSPEETTLGLSSAASGEEQQSGLTFPGLYSMLAQVYLLKYRYNQKTLASVAVKNHYHGSLNNNAQHQKIITIDQVLDSPYIADPLKVLDCSPVSDGSCSVILTNNQKIINKSNSICQILSSEMATDTISLKNRKNLVSIPSTQIAASKSYSASGLKPKDISIAEVHDCFTIAEILAMEDLGFCRQGQGGKLVSKYATMFGRGGKLIVNTSGGLKAAGHPVGATGIKQVGEVYLQLTGQAVNRQVRNCKYGLAHNVGGSGGTAVVTILTSL